MADVIVSGIDFVDGEFWGRNPHDELTWLRANAPVFFDVHNDLWGVSTYELVRQVASQPQVFSSAQGMRPDYGPSPMMIDMDDPQHRDRRKLVSKGFTPRRVRDREDHIRGIVDHLIDAVCERGECDLVWDLAAWLPLIVIADELGIDPPDREQLLHWSDDLMRMLGQKDDATQARGVQASTEYFEYAQRLVTARREQGGDDLVSLLAHSEVDGHRLGDFDIIFETLLILIGGDETTRHVISGGAYQLLIEPERWEAVREDRSLLPSAVEEMLRWVSPIKNTTRMATVDVELGGQQISAGQQLLILLPSANRDEAVFEDPFRFDIRRTPNEHVAFGFGTHFCLGASLARLELRVIFDELLDRLPDLRLATPDEPTVRPANFTTGYEGLPVRFTPTAPKSRS